MHDGFCDHCHWATTLPCGMNAIMNRLTNKKLKPLTFAILHDWTLKKEPLTCHIMTSFNLHYDIEMLG